MGLLGAPRSQCPFRASVCYQVTVMETELLKALKRAIAALNTRPNFMVRHEGKKSYELLSELDEVVRKAEDQCHTMSRPSTS